MLSAMTRRVRSRRLVPIFDRYEDLGMWALKREKNIKSEDDELGCRNRGDSS